MLTPNRFSLQVLHLALVLSSAVSCAAQGKAPLWVGSWGAAPYAKPNVKGMFAQESTIRETIHLSVGGSSIRIVLTNEFGKTDLKIAGASVALPIASADPGHPPQDAMAGPNPTGAIQPSSAHAILVAGKAAFSIAPGALMVSDPIPFAVAPQSDLVITLHLPSQTIDSLSYHQFANTLNFIADGDQLNVPALSKPDSTYSWWFLKGVQVQGKVRGTVVCFGDSITDGALSRTNSNHRYPDILAARLQTKRSTAGLGVVNEGIGGNSLLHDGTFTGPNALERFDRDVIAQAGIRYVVVLEGINDIGRIVKPQLPEETIGADDLIAGYRQLIARAHTHGIKIIGATLTPYGGSHSDTPAGQDIIDKVNAFILKSGEFDGAVDFYKATGDPDDPRRFAKQNDGHDHLHPSDAGYQAMANSIDLKLFAK